MNGRGRALTWLVGALLLTGCNAGGQQASPSTAPNFTGGGAARLELAGEILSFEVACESTEAGGAGRLLISGQGAGTDLETIAVTADVSLHERTGSMGVNLAGAPPRVLQAPSATVDAGPPLRISGPFDGAGDGILTVEGCTPTGSP